METFKSMSAGRRLVWLLQITGFLACLVLWTRELADIAWFTGVIALGIGAVSLRAETRSPEAGDWLGIVVVVSHMMSVAVSGAAYGLEGAASPWAVLPGILGILVWLARPNH